MDAVSIIPNITQFAYLVMEKGMPHEKGMEIKLCSFFVTSPKNN